LWTDEESKEHHTFYTRVQNLSTTQFTGKEYALLNKGLQHNLHDTNGKWIEELALETEIAIAKLNIHEQDYYKCIVANNLNQLTKTRSTNNITTTRVKKNGT
jgi:hypothetical protein